MPTPSNYGANYSRWFQPVPGEEAWIPFPRPVNDGQKVANARARAARAGQDIGSGYLDPKSGVLSNPNDEPWYLDPRIIGPLAVGAATGVGALAGGAGAGGTATVIPGTGIPTAGGGVGVTAPTTAGTIAGTTAAGTSALDKIRHTLTSSQGIASLASLMPALIATANGGSGSGSGSGSDELSRIQAITEARMRRADPLHQVAVQLAFGRAPVSAREGVTLQNVPLPR